VLLPAPADQHVAMQSADDDLDSVQSQTIPLKPFVRHIKESQETKFDEFIQELSDAWDDDLRMRTIAAAIPNGTKRTPSCPFYLISMRAGNLLMSAPISQAMSAPISEADRALVNDALALFRQTGRAQVFRCDVKSASTAARLWQIGIDATYRDQYDWYTMIGEQLDQVYLQLKYLRKETKNLADNDPLKYCAWVPRCGFSLPNASSL